MRRRLEAIWQGTTLDPVQPPQRQLDRFTRTSQALVSILFVLIAAGSVQPLGLTGKGLLGLGLLVGCSIAVLGRSCPDRLMPPTVRAVVIIAGGLFAAAMFGFAPYSWGESFAFIMTGHAGFRWAPRYSVPYAAALAALAALAVLVAGHTGSIAVVALASFLAVFVGITRRERLQTLRAADEAVLQARRAAESEALAGALAERARLAREIHDVLAHSLSGVNMQLSLAEAMLEAERREEGLTALRSARAATVEGIGEVRRAVQALRENTLDLKVVLPALVGAGNACDVDPGSGRLTPTCTQVVVRIAQEAVTNARRHAPGAHIALDLSLTGDTAALRVHNEPARERADPSPGSGLGLVGMRERAASVNGTLDAGPTPQGGWLVTLIVPIGIPKELAP